MKLKEIYKLTLDRIGERENNRQIQNIVMAGINAGYKIIAVNNKKSKSTTINAELNTPLILPDDFINLVMLLKEGQGGGPLAKNEYYVDSNLIIITNPDMLDDLTMIYNYIPLDLIFGTDDEKTPEIQAAFHSALSSYAAYYYYNMKGEINAANACITEFNSITRLADKVYVEKNTQLEDVSNQ